MKKHFYLILAACATVISCNKKDVTSTPVNPESCNTTRINFTVTDGITGYAIPNATISVKSPDGKVSVLEAAKNGTASFLAVNGRFTFTINGQGYTPLETYFSTDEDSAIHANIDLDPVLGKTVSARDEVSTPPDQITISGYLSDAGEHQPLAGVQVNLGSHTARTDAKGYFTASFPVAPISDKAGWKPENITISTAKGGFATHTLKNFHLIPGSYTFKIALNTTGKAAQTEGEETEYLRHGMFDRTESDDQIRMMAPVAAQARAIASVGTKALPASIRVGLSCSCHDCSSVRVMSLEAYTQSGLDNEWISSWKAASLRAGAVAYRSYGAWFVQHPIRSNYDIASTTCAQAWGSETASTTISAAQATAGKYLSKGGAIFRSEYSAENNNSGCGNGFSGTGSSWPCISDARCAGRAKNGHGRGMCQWGSSFWASDKDYVWILNHYYNPGGVTVQ